MITIKDDESYKPLMQRKSTWLIVGIITAIGIAGYYLIIGIVGGINYFATYEDIAVVVSKEYKIKTIIYKWSTVREVNESSVPQCAWDIEEDTYYVCTAKNSTGNCVSGHWETDYDYNVRDWQKYDEVFCESIDKTCKTDISKFEESRQYRFDDYKYYFLNLIYKGNVSKHEVYNSDGYSINDRVKVKVWKQNNKIKKVIQ